MLCLEKTLGVDLDPKKIDPLLTNYCANILESLTGISWSVERVVAELFVEWPSISLLLEHLAY